MMSPALSRRLRALPLVVVSLLVCSGCEDDPRPPPPSATGVVIRAFAASRSSVPQGETTTLSWQVERAASIRLTAAPGGDLLSSSEASGSVESGRLGEATRFTLRALGPDGSADERSLMVEVKSSTVTSERPVITVFDADPRALAGPSTSVTVWYTTLHASQVDLTADGERAAGFPSSVLSATVTIVLDSPATLALVATGEGGEARAEIAIAPARPDVEPNDTPLEANELPSGLFPGTIAPAGDVDWYRVRVPAGGHLFAETQPAALGGGCLDTLLTLFAPDGATALVEADDASAGVLCSRIDPVVEPAARDLPAGWYFVRVRARGPGGYTLSLRVGGAACGNNILEHGEQCEDGNTTNGDRCSGSCQIEFAAEVAAPGGTVPVSVPPRGDVLIRLALSAGQGVSADTAGCGFDTTLSLLDSTLRPLGLATVDGAGGPCAAIPFPGAFNVDLPAGTYYLAVGDQGGLGGGGQAVVSIQIHDPECGNGALERLAGEQCDDGNRIILDGCDASCRDETLGSAMGPGGPPVIFTDELDTAGEDDRFQITMSAPGFVRLISGSPVLGACAPDADLEIEILDSTLSSLGGPYARCGSITGAESFALLQPGVYWVRVRVSFLATVRTIPAYQLRVSLVNPGCGNAVVELGEGCDDANLTAGDGCDASCALEGTPLAEAEPNDTAARATASGAQPGQTVVLSGAITPAGDTDVHAFTVPAGSLSSLTARVFTSLAAGTECAGADTVLTLKNAAGGVLAENDDLDPGNSPCSLIADDLGASSLPPGTYYLEVIRYSHGGEIRQYYLSIALR